ncbi:hypothetical protein JKF63_06821 [Porcisia hertigi]|uniref:NRDE protein n=1 Tax=Porcisia hertigi TaxID=2761500 RepID=A0A836YH39_9TRYP|nr:hypothetical protein JKF63_06821 [Porcisia hertigi]
MCILAFITRYCERFPFILISNRDENLARGTGRLALDPSTGLLWAVDRVAGGSWIGIDPRSGRFAVLTNCRRSAAAPLSCHKEAHEGGQSTDGEGGTLTQRAGISNAATVWRGSAPLSHILAHTTVVPATALSTPPSGMPMVTDETRHPHDNEGKQMVTLAYNPRTSRGTVIKKFLQTGILPGDAGVSAGNDDALASTLPAVLRAPPYYAGFNLLSCDNLRGDGGVYKDGGLAAKTPGNVQHASGCTSTTAPEILYTTNRYAAEHRCPVTPGRVHCLQNSYLDNMQGEPITARLGQLFTDSLHSVIDPIAAENSSSSMTAMSPAMVAEVATALADECLCDRCGFDLLNIEKTASSAEAADALRAQLHSTDPLLGFNETELHEYFGRATVVNGKDVEVRFCDGGAAMREAHLQSSIFKVPCHGYGTRVQSVVLVERVAAVPSTCPSETPPARGTMEIIHFCQREVSFDPSAQRLVAAPWITYRIFNDGRCVCDSAEPPTSP